MSGAKHQAGCVCIDCTPPAPRTSADVVEILRVSLLTRKGETITEELALERARNAACALVELVCDARAWRSYEASQQEKVDKQAAESMIGRASRCAGCEHHYDAHTDIGACRVAGCSCQGWEAR